MIYVQCYSYRLGEWFCLYLLKCRSEAAETWQDHRADIKDHSHNYKKIVLMMKIYISYPCFRDCGFCCFSRKCLEQYLHISLS